MIRLPQSPGFATLVRDFFCQRLLNQQNVSPNTVAAYRDTFRNPAGVCAASEGVDNRPNTRRYRRSKRVGFFEPSGNTTGQFGANPERQVGSRTSICHIRQCTGANGPPSRSACVGYPTEAIHSPLGWSSYTSRDRSCVEITGSLHLEWAAGPCIASLDVQYGGTSLGSDRSSSRIC